ncbi:MAG TPA: hypothetical protein DHW31_11915 [Bacteroides graminisolvens]|uniref:Uncharacterized protein n=1 Tax=Bacteroides graminisolvens TaxID=477666 RepID=A0A3D2SIW7_9BACE|nr:hypothetical protein [Bacteroides graminisolvens]
MPSADTHYIQNYSWSTIVVPEKFSGYEELLPCFHWSLVFLNSTVWGQPTGGSPMQHLRLLFMCYKIA